MSKTGKLYVGGASKVYQCDIDGKGFKTIAAQPGGGLTASGYLCTDREGNLYYAIKTSKKWDAVEQVQKYGPDGRRLKFGENDAITMDSDIECIKGLWVTPDGDIYVSMMSRNRKEGWVNIYGPDGTLKKKQFARIVGPNGIALGRDGSLYVVDGRNNHGSTKMATYWKKNKFKEPEKWWYSLYDKVIKLPPSGGDGEKDAEWSHAGVSGTNPSGCSRAECTPGHITVDADDRVWFHDAVVYNVKALDAAGNLMLRVGVYGNEDCKGGGGDRKLSGTNIVIDPEIPLTRPTGVAVHKDYLFIADMFSHRVLRCRLEYADRKEITVK